MCQLHFFPQRFPHLVTDFISNKEVTRSDRGLNIFLFYAPAKHLSFPSMLACMLNSTVVACGVACVHIVSVFVCSTSVIAFQEVRNCLFKCSGMVKQTHSKAKTQMQTQAKNIP